jgi:hypothetical protein
LTRRLPSNPFGHIAVATTGSGIYSYDTVNRNGASVTDYPASQLGRGGVSLAIIPYTTPEEEARMRDALTKGMKLPYSYLKHNCSTVAGDGLKAGGVSLDVSTLPKTTFGQSDSNARSDRHQYPPRWCHPSGSLRIQPMKSDLYDSWFETSLMLAVGFVVPLAAIAFGVYKFFSSGELGDKKYYAALNAVYGDEQVGDDRKLIVARHAGGTDLDAAGVLPSGTSRKGRVWVGLNRTSSNGAPLIFPGNEPLDLQCADLKKLSQEYEVAQEVRMYLEQHCQK